jgi:serine/threonine-protein kinase
MLRVAPGDRLNEEVAVSLEIGMQPIPGYRLTGLLGAGSFAEVWEAVREDGQRVALKFLDTRTRGSSMIASEIRVLRSLAELQHPHIIQLHTVQAAGKYVILVMERATCNLADLRDAYKAESGANVPPEHALELLEQAAIALDFLATLRLPGFNSTRGLQHCDIKPSNLLMVGHRLKVGDFGLCAGAGSLTHGNCWKGTRPYAAPELFNGLAAPGTDQFALAVTFCEMVMGNRVFYPDQSLPPTGLPIDLTKVRDTEFAVLARALHQYPSSRWPTCRAFIQALRKATQQPREPRSVKIFPRGMHGCLHEASALTDTPSGEPAA